VDWGLLPWSKGEALDAIKKCFDAWLENRGGTGAAEDTEILKYAEQHAKFDASPVAEANNGFLNNMDRGEGFLDRLKSWATSKGIIGEWSNRDRGWNDVQVSQNSIRSVVKHNASDRKLAVIEIIPKLIENGIYLEPTAKTGKLTSHVFAGKVIIDGKPYVVGFVIHEDVNGKRYYNHDLIEIYEGQELFAPGPVTVSAQKKSEGVNANSVSIANIVRKHLGVNPDFTLNSSGPGGKLRGQDKGNLGYTRFTPDAYRIVLGKNANLSTLLYFFVGHERSRNESEPAYRAPLKILGISLGTTIFMIFFIV
jgi:hypothetical protein